MIERNRSGSVSSPIRTRHRLFLFLRLFLKSVRQWWFEPIPGDHAAG